MIFNTPNFQEKVTEVLVLLKKYFLKHRIKSAIHLIFPKEYRSLAQSFYEEENIHGAIKTNSKW